MKNLLRLEERNETLVARFGGAELIRTLDGRFELRGGNDHDRSEAREWVSMFMQGIVFRVR